MSFYDQVLVHYDWDELLERLNVVKPEDVEKALNHAGKGSIDDFIALVSPVAKPYLEEMAQASFSLTRKRFGNNLQMFIPIYLSNHCKNICTYCGFSVNNPMKRLVLTIEEAQREIEVIKSLGLRHVLLLTGEDSQQAGVSYLGEMIKLFKANFDHVSLEVQPLAKKEYSYLREEGLDAVIVYQETYNENNYPLYHPRGKKANFKNRLATMDALGQAEIHKMGLGVLLGLEDWRVDSICCALHLEYLKKYYWKTGYAVSFPRLRPAEGVNKNDYRQVGEKDLAQLMMAYRIWDEDLELSLSTRESEHFRNHMVPLGVTHISAGSKTNPGGYACYPNNSLEQFAIADNRPPDEVKNYFLKQGFEVVLKDWASEFSVSHYR